MPVQFTLTKNASERRKPDRVTIWSRDLKDLACPGCGRRGTLRFVPDGSSASKYGDAIRYRCQPAGSDACTFEGHDDEPALIEAVERLRRERSGNGRPSVSGAAGAIGG